MTTTNLTDNQPIELARDAAGRETVNGQRVYASTAVDEIVLLTTVERTYYVSAAAYRQAMLLPNSGAQSGESAS